MRIARVFPRRTRATPTDDMTFVGGPDLFPPVADEIHISVTFSWDLPVAEQLAIEWSRVAPVKLGGPATGEKGGDFVPGMYVAQGYTITSRGCPNHCWFCSVWKRDGDIRELPIRDGWNVLDDNLLACSDQHIQSVFEMLKRQKERPTFTGGLEAKRLQRWHVEALAKLRPQQMFFAYDTADDWEPLVEAAKMLREAGFNRQKVRCYVLIGHPRDTVEVAEKRLLEVAGLGIYPMAMLWRDESGKVNDSWKQFQRGWARPALIYGKLKHAKEMAHV